MLMAYIVKAYILYGRHSDTVTTNMLMAYIVKAFTVVATYDARDEDG